MRLLAMLFFFMVLSEMSQVCLEMSAYLRKPLYIITKALGLVIIPAGLIRLVLFPHDVTLLFTGVYFSRLANAAAISLKRSSGTAMTSSIIPSSRSVAITGGHAPRKSASSLLSE